MAHTLQVTIGDPGGVNRVSLISALEDGYLTLNGNPVVVQVGEGQMVDGLQHGIFVLQEMIVGDEVSTAVQQVVHQRHTPEKGYQRVDVVRHPEQDYVTVP